MRKRSNKGFTLIEMLVVIAIIAVLVAIIIPTISISVEKSKAAADAANMRSVLAQANVVLMDKTPSESALQAASLDVGDCKRIPGADMYLMYVNPGFIKVFYVDGTSYYSLDYFAKFAEYGEENTSFIYTADTVPGGQTENTRWFNLSDLANNG